MNSAQVINIYEDILAITRKMLIAAQNSDWDKLVKLEQECKRLTNELKINEPEPILNQEQQQQKLKIIRQVLDDDAQIRSITEPWMEKLQDILCTGERKRNLQQAYESGHIFY